MKRTLVLFMLLLAISATAYAGVMETISAVASSGSLWAGIVTVVLLFLFKAIPNDEIQATVGGIAYKLGVVMTLGLSKYNWSKPFWQSIVEPYFIDLVQNTVGTFVTRWVDGLRSDNPVA